MTLTKVYIYLCIYLFIYLLTREFVGNWVSLAAFGSETFSHAVLRKMSRMIEIYFWAVYYKLLAQVKGKGARLQFMTKAWVALGESFYLCRLKNHKMRSRNRKGKLLVKPSRVALVRSSGQYFDTLRTEVDQIPEVDIRKYKFTHAFSEDWISRS